MAVAPTPIPPTSHPGTPGPEPLGRGPTATPGKVALWLFLATEVMFFTGLIGSYIVLRAGSPPGSYSNLYAPATDLSRIGDAKGVVVESVGAAAAQVAERIRISTGRTEAEVATLLHDGGHAIVAPLKPEQAEALAQALKEAGATAKVEGLETYTWPEPYHAATNPLSIDLTAVNTFILICSSVTMVLALAAIQRGDQAKLKLFLLATVLLGSVFLGVQVYEYRALMYDHHYPVGVSADGHFRPGSSLFASCFFTMTGFHGAHVAGGILALTGVLISALLGRFTKEDHSAVELAGLYWHFVDLVWILLFTVVYLI